MYLWDHTKIKDFKMKISIKYIVIVCLTIGTFYSCGTSSEKDKNEKNTSLPVKLETISLGIEGMTCEIGCAKTIESKISKIEGVTKSKVSFETKEGVFTYDANKISGKDIAETIDQLLDGKTYKTTHQKIDQESCKKLCCEDKERKACSKIDEAKCDVKKSDSCEKKCDTIKKEYCINKKEAKCDAKKDESCEKKCDMTKKDSCKVEHKKSCCASKK